MIFHISSVYPPKLGGIEKVVRSLAKTQKENGEDVSVITSDQGIKDGDVLPDDFPVLRLRSFVFANTTIIPSLFFRLLKLKRTDVAHIHIAQAFVPETTWLASKVKHFKYVAQIHLDVPPSGPAGFLLKVYKPLILKRVLRSAKFVAVFTKDQKAETEKKYKLSSSQVVVMPNGVEDEFYFDSARSLHKKPRLLFVGRLNYQKNLQQIFHALEGVSDQFETTIVGSGEMEVELKQLASSLKLKNVNFVGRKGGNDLLKQYKRSDIFILSSEREGMPLVLLEAMAMGLPVIATNVTGNRDVIANGKNGLLVPLNDSNAFRQALLKIKADTKLYKSLSQSARETSSKYNWEKVATKFIELYIGRGCNASL